ncbi:flavodoxin family protein [Sinanaerobacter chloroacetimidivorans]|uniref:NAD(P)H-dependent oxidoreductase n=1 Tax=Sinanaerobacter chloroacetimidivorans TaxID=2818044 RepID=A0A8J7W4H0_9FIRM|nr:NAD(P)H-dependent oxidoreductase [Sinanaerobacter chloroacetimidivorans]MBR0598906.1 NAD(P)H-dependent oxidoreductase [Sinanaerobacter chloroacetimidivorans]
MADIILIRPHCREKSKTKRLSAILESSLAGYTYDTITTVEEFEELKNKKLLFAISLGESGINLELYGILKKIRLDRSCFEGSVGGFIVDGNSELYTKSIARELAFSANLAGCTFPGKPLVEGTRSLNNFNVVARKLDTDNLQAYMHSGHALVDSIMNFNPPRHKKPKILVLHASNYQKSNTINLWHMVHDHLGDCEVTEVSLRNGAVVDCIGCPYKTCKHFGTTGNCVYGGVIVEQVYPAIMDCDALVMLCPNYNDAISANLSAFINRLTALLRMTKFYDKYLFSIIVSGYSGSDIVAQQLISGLNMNKTFILPGRFSMLETANNAGSIYHVDGIQDRASAFANNILSYIGEV